MAINIFKDIPGYGGRYQASENGQIKSYLNNKYGLGGSRVLKQGKNKEGYLQVILSNETGKRKSLRVHRLIALTFIKEIKGKTIINHKNSVRDDNRVANLEWCTQQENIQHSWDKGISKPHTEKKITQVDLFGNKVDSFISITKASNITGINRRSINNCLKGWSNTAGNFFWNYS